MYYMGIDSTDKYSRIAVIDDNNNIIASHSGKCIDVEVLKQEECLENFKNLMDQFYEFHTFEKNNCGAIAFGCKDVNNGANTSFQQILNIQDYNCIISLVNETRMIISAENLENALITKVDEVSSYVECFDSNDEIDKCGEWNQILVDVGSDYWIGLQALKKACLEFEGRAEDSFLTYRIKEYCSISSVKQLNKLLSDGTLGPTSIAKLAEIVRDVAVSGDLVALKIEAFAGKEIFKMLECLVKRNKLENASVILLGKNIVNENGINKKYTRLIKTNYPEMKIIKSKEKKEFGASVYAKKLAYTQ